MTTTAHEDQFNKDTGEEHEGSAPMPHLGLTQSVETPRVDQNVNREAIAVLRDIVDAVWGNADDDDCELLSRAREVISESQHA